jgi:hypothetical protein
MTAWRPIVAIRSSWATRNYGHERDVAIGSTRARGLYGNRLFYGPNAERKAARDRRRRA